MNSFSQMWPEGADLLFSLAKKLIILIAQSYPWSTAPSTVESQPMILILRTPCTVLNINQRL